MLKVFQDPLVELIQDVGPKSHKIRPRQIHTYFFCFTLLRCDPVTLRKGKDKKRNSNKKKKSKIFFLQVTDQIHTQNCLLNILIHYLNISFIATEKKKS